MSFRGLAASQLCGLVGVFLAACGGLRTGASVPGQYAAETLKAERDEWRGPHQGALWLRHEIRVEVGTAPNPRRATSRVSVHLVRVDYTARDQAMEVTIPLPGPASLDELRGRRLGVESLGTFEPRDLGAVDLSAPLDPERVHAWRLQLPPCAAGEILELEASFELEGTIVSDARTLAMPDSPTAELLLRYDLPSHADAALHVDGVEAKPLVTRAGGDLIMALRLTKIPAESPWIARYVTRSAAPKNYAQRFVSSWAEVAAPYRAALVDKSPEYRRGYRVPVTPSKRGLEAVDELYEWVRDRLQRDDALSTSWRRGRVLAPLLRTNDLTGTDKVHLLHWLLEAAEIPHTIAVGRSASYPALDPTFATPAAFDVPLIYVPEGERFLDPACRSCSLGQVREALRGRQVMLLDAEPSLRRLPDAPPTGVQ